LRKKRILLLSEGFGTGHTQAAHALSVSLRRLSPDVQTRVLELGAFLHPTLARIIFSAYRKTIVSNPQIYGFVYRKHRKSLNGLTGLALHRIFYSQTLAVIKQLKPDTIVCTHPFPSAVVSRLKRAGLSVPLCTVITDYAAHGLWISPEVNKYFVSTDEVKQHLLQSGVPDHRVEVTGIPVHPDFWKQHDKDELLLRFGLKRIPTILVMGGGWGLGQREDMLAHMVRWRDKLQFIFCLGNNEKALARLAGNPTFHHPNIHLFGYTREIDKLMDVADLLITKPGGVTCAEGMAKGLPMLFYTPIPGHEEENCHYFTRQGLGAQIQSLDTLDCWFARLLDNCPTTERYSRMQGESATGNPNTRYQAILEL
jgi:processive 1,2-diacylglycerol beta-glucosyltransferase